MCNVNPVDAVAGSIYTVAIVALSSLSKSTRPKSPGTAVRASPFGLVTAPCTHTCGSNRAPVSYGVNSLITPPFLLRRAGCRAALPDKYGDDPWNTAMPRPSRAGHPLHDGWVIGQAPVAAPDPCGAGPMLRAGGRRVR